MPTVVVNERRRTFEIVGVSNDDPYIHAFLDQERDSEPGLQRFCSAYFRDDAIALDIGANIGVTPLILSAYFDRGHVYAVEAGGRVFEALRQNIVRNDVKNITPFNYAISNESGVVKFNDNSAWGSIVNDESKTDGLMEVRALTLDEFTERLNLSRVDLVKVDIEGFESLLFQGARKMIEKFSPVIYFELNTWAMLVNGPFEPLAFLEDVAGQFEYVYRVIGDGENDEMLQRIEGPPRWVAQQLVHDNIVHHGSVTDVVVSKYPLARLSDNTLTRKVRVAEELAAERAVELENVRAELLAAHGELESIRGELQLVRESLEASKLALTSLESEQRSAEDARHAHEIEIASLRAKLSALADNFSKKTLAVVSQNGGLIRDICAVDVSDHEYVRAMYVSLLNREPDEDGFNHFVGQLEKGHPRVSVMVGIARSREFEARLLAR